MEEGEKEREDGQFSDREWTTLEKDDTGLASFGARLVRGWHHSFLFRSLLILASIHMLVMPSPGNIGSRASASLLERTIVVIVIIFVIGKHRIAHCRLNSNSVPFSHTVQVPFQSGFSPHFSAALGACVNRKRGKGGTYICE